MCMYESIGKIEYVSIHIWSIYICILKTSVSCIDVYIVHRHMYAYVNVQVSVVQICGCVFYERVCIRVCT